MDFKKNGTAELRLSNGSQLVFSFDTAVAERVLFRSQELWPKLQVGPGQVVQDNMISFTYARDTRSCFLEYSQNLPLSTLLANWWGVGAWYGLEANQEDVSLTLLSQVLPRYPQKSAKNYLLLSLGPVHLLPTQDGYAVL